MSFIKEKEMLVTGSLTIVLYDEHGNIKDKREIPNLVVTSGKNYLVSRAVGVAKSVMSHMGVGTSSTAPAINQTALVAQLSSRVALSSTSSLNNTITYVTTFAAGVCTGALTEAGVFNASTSGDMLCRTTFPVVNKGSSDSLVITWVITVN